MKKTLILLSALAIIACKEEPKDYATLSGKITNPHPDKTLKIFKGKEYEKLIPINDDGTFKDTLKVEEGKYMFFDGTEYGELYLKNDNETAFTLDTKSFDESLTFSGDASDINNFFIKSTLLRQKHLSDELFETPNMETFNTATENLNSDFDALLKEYPTIDSSLTNKEKSNLEKTLRSYQGYIQSKLALLEAMPKGSASPVFTDYENIDGTKTSLADLKGKYVYIDVWATWCGPCKREIPALKELDKEYHDKNISFVSISIDDDRTHKGSWEQANADWKAMVKDKELEGIQLFAPKGWQSQFVQDYQIKGIPRFILVDPEGNIVTPDAPRPSSNQIKELFNSLEI
ncbi:TlpA family protein disulfide reductase [Mangrovimonas aestuarii]|uniref:TlpA family protein disulfide reductase n=1 Tax=Mangrovimonas aestuarii TaxID=3018443 RepID=UPI002378CD96|nr:TlpA disulfide reductase family protein [Mangrovimonas aestuarii]